MPARGDIFAAKKQKILRELSKPDEEYTDLSPKGSIDAPIREFVDEINQLQDYVTTSSCSGRISVYEEGGAATSSDANLHVSSSTSNQGKGGGKWLYVSHEPVPDTPALQEPGALQTLLGLPQDGTTSYPPPTSLAPRLVHFKFEPMILHILTSSPLAAQKCHVAAMSAGFRESGISSIIGEAATPIVAVRTQGLALESIIAFQDDSGRIRPMVSEAYLRTLMSVANARFVANRERIGRFRAALLSGESSTQKQGDGEDGGWEDADVRKERKRAQGLKRKEEMARQQEAGHSIAGPVDEDLDMELFA